MDNGQELLRNIRIVISHMIETADEEQLDAWLAMFDPAQLQAAAAAVAAGTPAPSGSLGSLNDKALHDVLVFMLSAGMGFEQAAYSIERAGGRVNRASILPPGQWSC